MKILRHTDTFQNLQGINLSRERLVAHLLQAIDSMTSTYSFLVPNGWRTIIMISPDDIHNTENIDYSLDVAADIGGGNYAMAKLSTLVSLGVPYTGNVTLRQVEAAVEDLANNDSQIEHYKSRIAGRNYSDPNEFDDELAEWLRDQLIYAPYLGGIAVPMSITWLDDHHKANSTTVKLYIAFSGASQEQDVMFVTNLLKSFQEAFAAENDNVISIRYDIDPLKASPTNRLWLGLLNISTVTTH